MAAMGFQRNDRQAYSVVFLGSLISLDNKTQIELRCVHAWLMSAAITFSSSGWCSLIPPWHPPVVLQELFSVFAVQKLYSQNSDLNEKVIQNWMLSICFYFCFLLLHFWKEISDINLDWFTVLQEVYFLL